MKIILPQTKGSRIIEVNFRFGENCFECLYCRHKSGLSDILTKRYEHWMCALTYEPLDKKNLKSSVGEYCPLIFEKINREENNGQFN